jgi:hypothetical protein
VGIQALVDGVTGQTSLTVTVPSIITAPAPSSGTYASSTFEDGTINPFANPWSTAIDVSSDPMGSGHGKVARVHYATDGITQLDDNKGLFPQNMSIGAGDSLWFQGDFYLPPDANMTPTGTSMVQRKLLYWKNDQSPHPFAMVVNSFGPQMAIRNLPDPSFEPGGVTWVPTSVVTLTPGAWHRLKVQMRVNSSFTAKDGILRVWLDGVLIFDHTDMTWTDPTVWAGATLGSYSWTNLGFRYQVSAPLPVSEYRYWDNVTFSKTPLEP